MLVVVVASFLLGMVANRTVGRRDRATGMIDRYVLWVALPALIVSKMSRASWGADTVVPVVVAWLAIGGSAVMITTVGRARGWDRATVGSLLMVGVLGNTSFLGLGVVQGFLGHTALPPAIAFDQLGTFLALATYGSFIVSRFGSTDAGWRDAVRRLSRFAPFLALMASPLVAVAHAPAVAYRILDVPGFTVAPLAMFSLGWRFAVGEARDRAHVVVFGLAWKMLVVPACVLAFAVAVDGHNDVAWSATVMQAGAPPMVTAGVVAVAAGLDATVATVMVATGTILSAVTLPMWWFILR